LQNHYSNIISSINYLALLLQQRLDIFFGRSEAAFTYHDPELINDGSEFYKRLSQSDLSTEEKIIFLIAFVPHIQPNFFDNIIQQYLPQGGDFGEIGGVKGSNQRNMLPTGETVQFILAGSDIENRLQIQQYISGKSVLIKESILELEKVKDGEPFMSGRIILSDDYIVQLLTDKEPDIKFSTDFPAKKITTQMNWDDAVLNAATLSQVNEIGIWLNHNKTLLLDDTLKRKIKPGFKVLFYGPPGTGKTLTASLLGKQHNKDVYRIDLSQIVSKYIGETEKNLEKVFAKAENRNWILFFDEADALFGKRTNVQNAHDRYANQEVSYLLQRVEDYPGLLILASNFKNNIDAAFVRRFNAMIYFPLPSAAERYLIWQKTFPSKFQAEPSLDIKMLAEKYELTGAAILSVVHYAALKAAANGDSDIKGKYVLEGIRKEFRKEDKSVN
jgi:hypothetical protein